MYIYIYIYVWGLKLLVYEAWGYYKSRCANGECGGYNTRQIMDAFANYTLLYQVTQKPESIWVKLQLQPELNLRQLNPTLPGHTGIGWSDRSYLQPEHLSLKKTITAAAWVKLKLVLPWPTMPCSSRSHRDWGGGRGTEQIQNIWRAERVRQRHRQRNNMCACVRA